MTDEERERIYEEEKTHADARSRLKQEKKAAAAALAAKNRKGCGSDASGCPTSPPCLKSSGTRTEPLQDEACVVPFCFFAQATFAKAPLAKAPGGVESAQCGDPLPYFRFRTSLSEPCR